MPSRPEQTIGDRARQARTDLGLNQAEVAERVGISLEVYGRFERGHVTPRISTLLRLCTALKVEPNDLLLPHGARPARNTANAGTRQILSIIEYASPTTLRRLAEVARWLVAGERTTAATKKREHGTTRPATKRRKRRKT